MPTERRGEGGGAPHPPSSTSSDDSAERRPRHRRGDAAPAAPVREPHRAFGGWESTTTDLVGRRRHAHGADVRNRHGHATRPSNWPSHAYAERVRLGLQRLGSEYGGWMFFQADLTAQSVVYSIGLGTDLSWDMLLVERIGCHVHGFDDTPKHNSWYKEQVAAGSWPPAFQSKFHRHAYLAGSRDGPVTLDLPKGFADSFVTVKEGDQVTSESGGLREGDQAAGAGVAGARRGMQGRLHTARALTLRSMMRMLNHSVVDVLKIDVEGAEFRIFDAVLADDRGHAETPPVLRLPVCQLLLEFHGRLSSSGAAGKAQALLSLQSLGFELIYNVVQSNGADNAMLVNTRFCHSHSHGPGSHTREPRGHALMPGSGCPPPNGSGGAAPAASDCRWLRQHRANVSLALSSGHSSLKWRQPGDGAPGPRPRTLLSIHSAVSYWHITELMLFTLAKNTDRFDVVLVDDGSKLVDIEAKAEELGVKVLRHNATGPRGNTYTWNLAWAYFMEHPEYANLIICNNDLLVPSGTVKKLEQALDQGWTWVLPMTSKRGTGYVLHRLQDHYPEGVRASKSNCQCNVSSAVRGCT